MKIGILTSSRADFGIYLPLLQKLSDDSFFKPSIIAFGTHLSNKFGYTAQEIESYGFDVAYKLKTIPENDTPYAISKSIAKTIDVFSDFWNVNKFDLVLAFGDRFEMFGAVLAGSPFNVKYAHIHAGETTLGAIDNAYRHSISLMSKYLFVTNDLYKQRAIEIIQRPDDVFNVGALSIDNLQNVELYSIDKFKKIFNINLNIPTILTTLHPETIDYQNTKVNIEELIKALDNLSDKYQIVITMPNADTMGLAIRKSLENFNAKNSKVILVESFGMMGYLSCMKHCIMLIGNTSSGFVEASYFPKWVINIGNRQNGRIITPNIFSIPISKEKIINTVQIIENQKKPPHSNIYGDGFASVRIIEVLKRIYHDSK